MIDLTGRKALVTGATGGIGESIARQLHALGATVGLHGTRVEKLESLAADLGDRVVLLPANLSDRDAVKELGRKAEAELEGVDILVNNAGITRDGLFVRMSDADWDAVMEVNLTAVFRLTRELTHPMMRRRFGRIVNITSGSVKQPIPGLDLSSGARAGLTAFVAGVTPKYLDRNVTINNLLPGMFATDRLDSLISAAMKSTGKPKDEVEAERRGAIPAKRFGKPEEFGKTCAFLCSAYAGYIANQNVLIDGGRYPGCW